MKVLHRWSVLLPFLLLWLVPVTAEAQLQNTLQSTGEYQYDSNILYLQRGVTAPGVDVGAPRGDSLYTISGTDGIKYVWSRQTLFADVGGSYYRYHYYSNLDHGEYHFDAGWNGIIDNDFTGNLEVLRTSTMIPFQNLVTSAGRVSSLSVTTEQREQGGLSWQFTPKWSIEGSGYDRNVTWPLPNAPNLKLEESQEQLTFKYMGTARLSYGISGAYTDGHYSNVTDANLNPTYQQKTGSLVATYAGSKSTFNGQVGYSQRTSEGAASATNDISGVTGSIAYMNQLTYKTSVTASLSRLLVAYLTDAGSEVDDVAAISLKWQATYKTGATLGYTYTNSSFPGQGAGGSSRVDHFQYAQLRIDYSPARWLAIRPFFVYQLRSSNLFGANFNATVAGVDLVVTLQN